VGHVTVSSARRPGAERGAEERIILRLKVEKAAHEIILGLVEAGDRSVAWRMAALARTVSTCR
jgi:hypothetical protein